MVVTTLLMEKEMYSTRNLYPFPLMILLRLWFVLKESEMDIIIAVEGMNLVGREKIMIYVDTITHTKEQEETFMDLC